ncbi:MAG: Holliday junction branch migration DNA helicase RuvB [Candidatus Yanofskybacteria bacterium CG10_big_fil_rev_8_21_14_0_10_46_23]|uniref:Holliday junction branch migration complex subunit RuvB n=1 Tax=Candidatus Yanofskybacteria bacterium CG10_big_fil_rev_8_21_14_0_10_46_23 TaxID=1975098 RepID=A0A2H0R4X3_9BACT|nr:MAG: Holliday junction branch migration DNA helicase RuvB [Candidatus Yanofskybacteria bacterium CG10_big_fil_rev_8_21_14_0_10_46_23]
MSTQDLTKPVKIEDDKNLDLALRPQTFNEYVGQERVKKNLSILIQAAQKRSEPIEHILIHGPSGLGKTTLAHLVAKEMGVGLRLTSGTALEKAGDVGSILTGLSNGDVLFIDEVHRLNKLVEETIYPAMEDFRLDIVIGKGNAAKTLQIDLPRFTIIAATTRISLLSNPFRSRFGVSHKLDYYQSEEITQILNRSAKLLGIKASPAALKTIAASARSTPRIANRLLKRCRDFAQVHNQAEISVDLAQNTLSLLEIDPLGLEATDRKILSLISEKFNGGPVGIKTIAAALSEEEQTIEDVYEPYLMQLGFIDRTPRGRIITETGKRHIGMALDPKQASLI